METLRMILAWPVLAAVMIFVIWQFLKYVARCQARRDKIKFNQDFALLEICVKVSEVNEISFKCIAGLFNDMEYYPADDRLEKLREDFEYKFREFLEPKVILN